MRVRCQSSVQQLASLCHAPCHAEGVPVPVFQHAQQCVQRCVQTSAAHMPGSLCTGHLSSSAAMHPCVVACISTARGLQVEDESYQLRPMNCPFHVLTFKSNRYSYRDLPLRWAELGTVYRYERSGTMHGLFRVRGFTQVRRVGSAAALFFLAAVK